MSDLFASMSHVLGQTKDYTETLDSDIVPLYPEPDIHENVSLTDHIWPISDVNVSYMTLRKGQKVMTKSGLVLIVSEWSEHFAWCGKDSNPWSRGCFR